MHGWLTGARLQPLRYELDIDCSMDTAQRVHRGLAIAAGISLATVEGRQESASNHAYQPLFAGLIVDEFDQAVTVTYVGEEPCYVVNDAGFLRHIPCEQVDRQVLGVMGQMIEGHEDLLAEQTAKMLGQEVSLPAP